MSNVFATYLLLIALFFPFSWSPRSSQKASIGKHCSLCHRFLVIQILNQLSPYLSNKESTTHQEQDHANHGHIHFHLYNCVKMASTTAVKLGC
jgi:hypothetical protein